MGTLRAIDVLWYTSTSDVAVLRWPEQQDDRERLDRHVLPRLLLINDETAPPCSHSCLEDWIRLPAAEEDVRARLEALLDHASRHPPTPTVDPWGQISFRGGTIFLSPRETAIAKILAGHFATPVTDEELITQAWPDGDATGTAVRVHISRLRKRIAKVGLTIKTIRAYGYMMCEK
jgi:hypothetical protein